MTTEETPTTEPGGATPAPEGATPAPPILGSDGTPLDPVRQQQLIEKLRGIEKDGKARDLAQQAAIRALVSSRPLTPAEKATIDAATPAADSETDHLKAAFSDLSSALGVAWSGDPAPLLAAARSARIEGALTSAILTAGGDLELTRLAVGPGLAAIDPSSPTLASDLSELVGHALLDHKALKRQTMAPVSGAPFPAGSGGSQAPTYITREAISMASAEQVDSWRRQGLIPGYAGDRK